jgi:hypothetical protein
LGTNKQLAGASVTCVLIGEETASRKWVKYEIEESYRQNMGIFGIYIHNLKNRDGNFSPRGENPFSQFNIDGKNCDQIFETYNPSELTYDRQDRWAYSYIVGNIGQWIENAAKQIGR